MTIVNLKQRAAGQLALLEERLTALLAECERLRAENRVLRERLGEAPAAAVRSSGQNGQMQPPGEAVAGYAPDLENANAP